MTPPTPPAQHREAALDRLMLFAEHPEHWRDIYNLAVSPDPCGDIARDIKTALAPTPEAERVWPNIGTDPLKGERRSEEDGRKLLREAYVRQQPHVPDQTALVWRGDLGRTLNLVTRLVALTERRNATNDPAASIAGESGSDRYLDGYAEGSSNAARDAVWMQDKAWMDAVLMLVHYQTLAERTWLVGHEEAAAKLDEWWKHARTLAETKNADDIAALRPPQPSHTAEVEAMREACACIAEMHDHRGDIAAAIRALTIPSTAAGEASERVAS